MVEWDAGLQNIDEGESPMSNTFLDKIGKMVDISCKASSDETGTADYRQGDGI